MGRKIGLISMVTVLASCGGGGGKTAGNETCGTVQPCGGSIVGTWTITSSCETTTDFTEGESCPAATLDESQVTTSGTLVFNTDMTFTSTTTVSGTRRFSVPLDCVPGVSNCDEYASVISPGPPDATTTCPVTGTNTCDCSMVYSAPMTGAGYGMYSTSGSTITVTSGTSSVAQSYCVQGNVLHLITTQPGTGTLVGDVVATK